MSILLLDADLELLIHLCEGSSLSEAAELAQRLESVYVEKRSFGDDGFILTPEKGPDGGSYT